MDRTSLAVLHAIGDIQLGGREEPLSVVEGDIDAPKDKAMKGEGDMLVKALKKEAEGSKQRRGSIMPILIQPTDESQTVTIGQRSESSWSTRDANPRVRP
ncbi:hypothetical protein FRC11_006524 [Ceratobasidium sp. 423]|nr:hypothetical protein FRC11_006524 [Ceratobasidium sp. 423]